MVENCLCVPETKYTKYGTVPMGTVGMINYVFQNTLSEDELYKMLKGSRLDDVVLKIYTTDFLEATRDIKKCDMNVEELSICKINNSDELELAIHELRRIADERYNKCKRLSYEHEQVTGERKLFKYYTYAEASDTHEDMKLILACFIGMDRLNPVLSKQAEDDILEILKTTRCSGVRLLLHSNKPGVVQKMSSKDYFMQSFLTWGIDADGKPEPSNWIFGSK